MTSPGDASALDIIYLQPEQGPNLDVGRLETALAPCSIATAHSPGKAAANCDDTVDCLLTDAVLTDGPGTELLDELGADRESPPVILLADASDGTVPVSAIREPFADVVALDEASGVAAVSEAVRDVVPDLTNPDIAGVSISDARSLTEWKARLLDQFFTKIPLHMFIKDESARHVLVSEGCVENRIHRISGEYLGRRDIDGVVPETEARGPYEDDLRVIENGERIIHKQERFAESGRWFMTSKVPWEGEDGDVIGVLGIAQEITEQKERERQLKIINHLVRHNLRNKLNVIGGRAEYLYQQTRCPDEQAETILNATTALSKQLDKQQRILRILEDPSKTAPLNLSELVANEIEAAAGRHPEAVITTDFEADVVASATADIAYAVSELVENAIVHCESAPPSVEVVVETGQDCARIRIRDECGEIPAFEVEVLTGQRAIDQLSHSTGLGLWISRWALDYSGGSIAFERRASGGNEVTVTVPQPEQDS